MTMLNKVALVLEGGGMRAFFSSGVLEVFLREKIDFPYISSISAGACNVASYVAHEPMRSYKTIEQFVSSSKYYGVKNFVFTGNLFNFDFIFGELTHKIMPFDFEAFRNSNMTLHVGTTDAETGRAVWFTNHEMDDRLLELRASAALPFISTLVKINGHKLLDGGMANPIPINKAMDDGYERFVVILTQNKGYRKEEHFPDWLLQLYYSKYPKLIARLKSRAKRYNKQLEIVEKLEREGKAIVLRPQKPIQVKRMDRDVNRLKDIHHQGEEEALKLLPSILQLAKDAKDLEDPEIRKAKLNSNYKIKNI